MWNDCQITRSTLDWLQAFIERRSVTREHARLLSLMVQEGSRQAAVLPRGLPPAEVPLMVHAAAGGDGPGPLPVAAACLCVYLGADVLDNVVDRELTEHWAAHGANQALLVAVTFGAPLAMACLDELEGPLERRLAAQRALIDTMLTMSAGQSADVAFEGRDNVSLDACEAMVVAKSGAEWSLFARLGALAAGAPSDVCEAYGTFGRELGSAVQLTSDSADLVHGGPGRDLASGKRTLPIVHALSVLPDAKRAELLGHLAAPHDAERRRAARRLLLEAGSFHFGALAAEVHRRRALTALRAAGPAGPPARFLHDLAEDLAIGAALSRSQTPHIDAGPSA
jgi:geranylgeranyl diphosphate synthase type I